MRVTSVRDLQTLVRARRKRAGLTQDELAERVGVSRKWVYSFETGTPKGVELSLVLRLLAALDLAVDVSESDEAPARRPVADYVDLDQHLSSLMEATRDSFRPLPPKGARP